MLGAIIDRNTGEITPMKEVCTAASIDALVLALVRAGAIIAAETKRTA